MLLQSRFYWLNTLDNALFARFVSVCWNGYAIHYNNDSKCFLCVWWKQHSLLNLFLSWSTTWSSPMRILAAISRLTTGGLDTRNNMTNFWLITLRDLSLRLFAEAADKKQGQCVSVKYAYKSWTFILKYILHLQKKEERFIEITQT